MKILDVKSLAFPEVKVIRFARFLDERGYFAESFHKRDLSENPETGFLKDLDFLQHNESFSKKNTIRGLHFQWQPFIGKFVRTVSGHMVDMVLDIRKNSLTYGKMIMYNMPAAKDQDYADWIWVPPGFAHGNFFLEETVIQYLCTAEYKPSNEAGISPLADDVDFSLCDPALKNLFMSVRVGSPLMSPKDRAGFDLKSWANDQRSNNFLI